MLLTVSQVANRLQVNKNKVYDLIKSGALPCVRLGTIKVCEDTLHEFIKERER